MHAIYELKEMLCKELEEVGEKGELTAGSLDTVDKLAHAIKNIDKIIESYEEEGYSNRGGSYEGGRGGNRGGSYNMGGSYARSNGRGRGSNARRDSMGRYSSERGYSRDAEDMIARLEDMMQDAPNEQVRQDMRNLVNSMRSM